MTNRQVESRKTPRGRPPVDSEIVRASLDRCVIDALDTFAEAENLSRPQAVRAVLADWLRTHGYKIVFPTRPEGPATDVVLAMDKAINEHRAKRKK